MKRRGIYALPPGDDDVEVTPALGCRGGSLRDPIR